MDIILASTSAYRRALLSRLDLPFQCMPPDVDEGALPGETPRALAARLALAKAAVIADAHPGALVIGSDQVAAIDDHVMGKPGTFERARAQLRRCSGRAVQFYTGVALLSRVRGVERCHVEPFTVRFRTLTDAQIANYLLREQPFDCAGSFKAEGLGIALFEQMQGNDPTSLEGLPLIALNALLAEAGVDVLGH